jgi:hypothetical protein
MRLDNVVDVGFNYKHFLHTHSHIAFLGWMYNALVLTLEYYFFKAQKTKFNQIFWVTQLTILGMLCSFPFQGYAFWSISFSTLYLFASYWLIFEIFKQCKLVNFKVSRTLLKAASVFLFLSSLGPFGLAIVMAKHLGHTMWNSISVFWFLHYLFNGFFFLLILAILLKEIKDKVNTSSFKLTVISKVFILSVIPLYFSFILEFSENNIPLLLSIVGAMLQFVGLLFLYKPLIKYINQIHNSFSKLIIWLFFIALNFKIIFQVLGNIDSIQTFVILSKSTVVIGFIHLVMLGILSLFIFWFFSLYKIIIISKLFKIGLLIFILGISLSELTLFGQSLFIYFQQISILNYNLLLFIFSSLMPIGILIILIAFLKVKNNKILQDK